jgi:anti-sigma B factor antagonist
MADPRISVDNLNEDRWLIALEGEHDLTTAPEIRAALDQVSAPGTSVVVDLSGATFIDSSVVHCLVDADRAVRSADGERLCIVAPPGSIPCRVLEITGLLTVLPVHDDRDAALRSLERL